MAARESFWSGTPIGGAESPDGPTVQPVDGNFPASRAAALRSWRVPLGFVVWPVVEQNALIDAADIAHENMRTETELLVRQYPALASAIASAVRDIAAFCAALHTSRGAVPRLSWTRIAD